MLKSTCDPVETVKLIRNTRQMCSEGGFKLTKIVCNSSLVNESIPEVERSKELQSCLDVLPNDHALGVQWNTAEDTLSLRTKSFETPTSKRSLLSVVHQVYDPLGMVSPLLLESKRLLQHLCTRNFGWDEALPEDLLQKCEEVTSHLLTISNIKIPRCFHPSSFVIEKASLHHFSDASDIGYGYCSYIRMKDANNKIHCAFVCGRSRVNPIKSPPSMPRMELIAAVLSSKLGSRLKREIDLPIQYEVYWSDSMVALGYIHNSSKKFRRFVSNRVSFIKEHTKSASWRYVSSEDNPSDISTRGLKSNETSRINMWLHGPEFLWKPFDSNEDKNQTFREDDPEIVKDVTTCAVPTVQQANLFLSAIGKFSSWLKIIRVTAFVMRFIHNTRNPQKHHMKMRSQTSCLESLTVTELELSRNKIFMLMQQSRFANVISQLRQGLKLDETTV